jgi:hypothetical protein
MSCQAKIIQIRLKIIFIMLIILFLTLSINIKNNIRYDTVGIQLGNNKVCFFNNPLPCILTCHQKRG